jgi:hypothetical protein
MKIFCSLQRSALGWLLIALPLASCALESSDTAQISMKLYQSVIGHGTKVAHDAAAAVPFASIGVEAGSSDQTMLVLGTNNFGDLAFYSANHIMIMTNHGRIVATAGLPNNLNRLQISNKSMLPEFAPSVGAHYQLFYDFGDLGLYSMNANCTSNDGGPENIEILGTKIRTRHIVEDCNMASIGWSFENEYWTDADSGYIWRSVQSPHPKLPALTIEVLRPEQQ